VTALAYLGLALVLCIVGVVAVMVTSRKPREGPHDSIDAFSRQLEVLGRFVDRPPDGADRRSRRRWRSR
jgi:hypothetical protein